MTHIDYTLYLVTDRSVMSAKSLEQAVEQAIQGGCTVVQLREKYASSRMVGPDKIIGVSAATLSEAIQAEQDGADYLGVGAMFATSTKTNTRPVTIEQLTQIKQAVQIPVVAIGGIQSSNVTTLTDTGIDGIAVVSAILAQENITHAAEQLKACFTGAGHEV